MSRFKNAFSPVFSMVYGVFKMYIPGQDYKNPAQQQQGGIE